jgi:hypothetical protein
MRRKGIIIAVALVVASLGIFWTVRYLRASTQLARVQDLRSQLGSAEKLPEEKRRELWGQLRQEMDKLPEDQREKMWREGRQGFEKQMHERMRAVLDASPDQRTALLDKQIDEMEKRRKDWEKRRQDRAKQGGGQGPGPQAMAGGPGGPGGPGGRGWGGPGGGPGNNQWAKRMLDNTTPSQRSEMYEYRRLMEARRAERQLPPSPGPGFPGPR